MVLALVPAVLAITVHEIAHGWTALKLGDTTARDASRLSLNPLRHIDPIGTLLVPVVLYGAGEAILGHGFFFGWARPVPVDWRRLSPRRLGIALVAAAGPLANLLMLLGWALVLLVVTEHFSQWRGLLWLSQVGVIFNAVIMVINLVPVPPLDGSRIVTAALPLTWARAYNRLERFGFVIIVALIAAGAFQTLLEPVLLLLERGLMLLAA